MTTNRPVSDKTQIVILGMHRSGTSAVTRLVNMMGAYVGPECLVGGPAGDNTKGFWERIDVRDLNDRILSEVGGAWDDPPATDLDEWAQRPPEGFMREARRIIADMDVQHPWVVKDPRFCLLLPFWLPLLASPVCLHVYRSPWEVAASLRARNGFSLLRGLALWESYTIAALRSSLGLPRICIDYNALIDDPGGSTATLYDELRAAGIHGLHMPPMADLREFIDARLQHQRAPNGGEREQLGSPLMRLARAIRSGSALKWNEIPAVSPMTRDILQSEKQRVQEMAAAEAFERECTTLTSRLSELQAKFDELSEQRKSQQAKFDELSEQNKSQQNELLAKSEALQAVENRRDQLQAGLDASLGDLRLLASWLRQIHEAHAANLDSWRWRVGHVTISMVERLMRRPHVILGMDEIGALLTEFQEWSDAQVAHESDTDVEKQDYLQVQPLEPARSDHHGATASVTLPSTYDLICLANIDWNARYQRPQQLAEKFAKHGHRVFYVVASRHLPESDPDGFRAVRVAHGVWEVEVRARRALDRYERVLDDDNAEVIVQGIDRLREAFDIVDAVVDVHLSFWTPAALKMRKLWRWCVLYDCMDEWEDFPNIGRELLEAERSLVRDSDIVTVTATLLEEKWRDVNPCCVLVRNGVDMEFFRNNYRPNNVLDQIGHPVIGFYGGIAEWVDLDLIADVARARPDWQFVLVGDVFVADTRGIERLSNVRLTGRQPYEQMPLYLYHFDVCLIPFRLNKVTHAVDPVKLYEYISVGKPVVATPLAELDIHRDYLYFAEGASQFEMKIEEALEEEYDVRRSARVEMARNHDWEDRYRRMNASISATFGTVSIIVVSYKNIDLTQLCIESILKSNTYPNYEVIVVDNNSQDGTANYLDYIKGKYSTIKVIVNRENRGFAAAINQGLEVASGEYLVLLNNDTVVPRGWLAPLLARLDDKEVGLVGPVTNFAGNEAWIDVPYRDLIKMNEFASNHMRTHAGRAFDIDVLAMFCVAMRRDVFERVGCLDERFGVGMFEDDDYSRRVREIGLRIVCAEDSFVHHFGQAAFKELVSDGRYQEIWNKNKAYYERKWGRWKPHSQRRWVRGE